MVVYAFLLGAISVSALDADAVKEAQKLNGEWRLVRVVFLGLQSEELECAGVRFIFRGGRLTIGPPESKTQFVYRLDVTKRPRAIDLQRVSAPIKGGVLRESIVSTATSCPSVLMRVSDPRSSSRDSPPGAGYFSFCGE
jgi:uncharacterized protein (TIGR03067 family)